MLSADLNALEDCVIGAKRPATTRTFWCSPAVFQTPGNWTQLINTGGINIHALAADAAVIALNGFEVNDRITACTLSRIGNASANGAYNLIVARSDGNQNLAGTIIGVGNDVAPAAVWADIALGSFVSHVMAAGEALFLEIATNAIGPSFGRIIVTYDRL